MTNVFARNLAVASILIVPLAISGCSDWPPYEDELKDRFFENREGLEILVEEIRGSKYVAVENSWAAGVTALYFEGEKWAAGTGSGEAPRDAEKWERLFQRADVDNVYETIEGDFVSHLNIYDFGSRKKEAFISYVLSPTIQERYRECAPEFAKSRCGMCIVHLQEDWWIKYGWEPSSLFPDAYESSESSQLSEDEILDAASAARDACLMEGGTQITGHLDAL